MLVPLPGGKSAPGVRGRADPGDRGPAGRAAPVADLGPGQGDGTGTRRSRSPRTARSTSATRTRPGSGRTNENTNGLLRQYFPKGTDLSVRLPAATCGQVADELNGRPRKTLGWKTPAEAMAEFLDSQAA